MKADYHLHTYYSDDSEYPMETLVEDAIALGIDEICFTDHVDYGIKADWPSPSLHFSPQMKQGKPEMNVMYPAYFAEIENLRAKYQGQISISRGLEFGVQVHTIPLYQRLYDQYPMDFVIMSNHQVGDMEFWTGDYQKGKSQREFNRGYYQEIIDCMEKYSDYSVLGHLDSIVRYDDQGPIAFSEIEDLVEKILKKAIADGKGIELNTSWRRYGLKDLTPSREILSMYRELGGEILTIGSDTHCAGHLYVLIEEAKKELKGMGFKHFCTYKNMEPEFHEL